MLNFFIENQGKMSYLLQENYELDELKAQCEKILSQRKQPPALSHSFATTPEIKIIPHHIPDEEYQPLFQKKNSAPYFNPSAKVTEDIFSIFTSPLNESWKEMMACKGDSQFAIRSGFYQNEFEIFHSILMGFQALTIYVSGLDVYQVQYLAEVARDYSFTILFVVHNREELNLVLETDAPYLLFSTFQKKTFKSNQALLFNLIQFVPKTVDLLALISKAGLKDQKILEELGYKGLMVS